MSLRALLSQTVIVLRYSDTAETDGYGNLVPGWTSPRQYPGRLEPQAGSEVTTGSSVQVSDWKLYLPPEAVIEGRDRVQADGVTYEVVGPPARRRTPRGDHHVEVRLQVVDP